MLKSSSESIKFTVSSLGVSVTYDPNQLFSTLRASHNDCNVGQGDIDHNIRIVMKLFRKLGHDIDQAYALGVIQLVYAGKHVSAVVLNEYKRVSQV